MTETEKMSLIKEFLKTFKSGLAKRAVFTIFPMSILLIPLESLSDDHFSCPCDVNQNVETSNLVFAAPFFFFLALMFLFLKPLKFDTKLKKLTIKYKDFSLCLIPSLVWVILLLLDGNYVACWKTDWNGEYVSDDHQVKWCKPTESIPGRNYIELRDRTLRFVAKSQRDGYITLLSFSILILLLTIPDFVCACTSNCCGSIIECIEDKKEQTGELPEELIKKKCGKPTQIKTKGEVSIVLLFEKDSEIENQDP